MLTSGWSSDLRDAVRAIRLRPLSAGASVLLTGIAVAALASAFAIVYGILWRPLPYPSADRLAVIWQTRPGERTQMSFPDYEDLRDAPVFDATTALAGGRGSLRVGDRIERLNALQVEPAGFGMLGAQPFMGRLLTASDSGQPLALVSYRLWSTHLGSDPNIIGRTLWFSGLELSVVGVLQPGFDFELPVPPSFVLEDNDIWTLLDRSAPFTARREVSTYEVLVRLAPERSLDEAQVVLDTVAARLSSEHPSTNSGRSFHISPLKENVVAQVRRPLLFVTLGGGVMLTVALANLIILSLVRRREQSVEFSVRTALGAGTLQLRRRLFLEHALLAAVGGLAGSTIAVAIVPRLLASEAARLPRPDAIRFDLPVLLLVAVVTTLIALVLTAQPLDRRAALTGSGMRIAGSGGHRARRLLVGSEIALAVALSAAGGLLGLSLLRLLDVDTGFTPEGAAAARISAYEAEYRSRDDVVRMFDEVLRQLRQRPDVQSAGAGSSLPLSGQFTGTSVVAEGRPMPPGERPTAGWQFVTPGYFAATGMRVTGGRDFSDEDRSRQAHVAVVNEELARQLFAGEDVIGRRIGVGGGDSQNDWHQIIGVVADVKHQALDSAPQPRVYDLFGQHWGRTLFVVARVGTGEPAPLITVMRETVNDLNANVPVFESATLQTLLDRSTAARRLASSLALALAASGLLLALIGVHAITAAAVTERTREIGVRAALGATPRHLFQLFAGDAALTVAGGGIAGLLASLGLARLMATQLFEVAGADAAWVVATVGFGVIVSALAAAVPPGRRAAIADPVSAMRQD